MQDGPDVLTAYRADRPICIRFFVPRLSKTAPTAQRGEIPEREISGDDGKISPFQGFLASLFDTQGWRPGLLNLAPLGAAPATPS